MAENNTNNNQQKEAKTKTPTRSKVAVGILTALLLASTSAAVAVPLLLLKKQKPSEEEVTYFNIEFDSDGAGTIPTQKIAKGKHATAPSVSKDGYQLNGWYETDGSTMSETKFDFTTTAIEKNIKLKAKWDVKPAPQETRLLTMKALDGHFPGSTSNELKVEFIKGTAFSSIVGKQTPVKDQDSEGKNYNFKQWVYAGTTTVVAETDVLEEDTAIEAQYEANNQAVVTFVVDTANETLIGDNSKQVTVNTTFTDETSWNKFVSKVKKDKYAFKGWALKPNGTISDVIAPTIENPIVISNDTPLYPVFEKDLKFADFEFHYDASKGQKIEDGDTKFTVAVGESGLKWGKVAKPSIVMESTPKQYFAGWYHNEECTWPWTDDDEVETLESWEGAVNHAYPLFVTAKVAPKITFMAKPDENITFIGNQVCIANIPEGQTSITLNDIRDSIPGAFKNAKGSWSEGYTSNYRFDHWAIKNGETYTEFANDSPISESITLYPEFVEKQKWVYYDRDQTTVKGTHYYEPTELFGEVVKPDVEYSFTDTESGATKYFRGWAKKGSTDIIEPLTEIGDEATEVSLVPIYDADVIQIEFNEKAYCYDASSTIHELGDAIYVGNRQLAITNKVDTSINNILKPRVSCSDEYSGNTYHFAYWEYKFESGDTWEKISTEGETVISKETNEKVLFRPIFEADVVITYTDDHEGITIPSGQTTLKATNATTFNQMFKPTLDLTKLPKEEELVFDNWYWTNPETGKEEVVPINQTFSKATTIKAKFVKGVAYTTVKYNLLPDETDPTAKIYGKEIVIPHAYGSAPTFGKITKGYAVKEGYDFIGWFKDTELKEQMSDEEQLPDDGTLNLYAKFEKNTSYHKVSVKESTEYTVENPQAFIQDGSLLLENFFPTIVKEGYKLKTNKFVDVDETTKVTSDMILEPDFEPAAKVHLYIDDEGLPGITDFPAERSMEVPYNALLKPYIDTLIKTYTPKLAHSSFKGWKIKYGTDSYGTYTDTTRFSTDIRIVPIWEGEGEFYNLDSPYFFDSEAKGGKKESAKIISFAGDEIVFQYANDVTEHSIPKSEFKYQVKLGQLMKKIPDYFMSDCSNWNNEGQPLVLPPLVTEIGSFFLANCSSFNSKIDLSNCKAAKVGEDNVFKIGESFLINCYAFNQDLDFSFMKDLNNAYVLLGLSFMSECMSYCSTITAECYFYFETKGSTYSDDYSLSTGIETTPLGITGYKAVGSKSNEFKSLFKCLSGLRTESYRFRAIKYI